MRECQIHHNSDKAIYTKGMDKIMADEMQQEELQQENKTLDKKQLKAAKKLEKKKKKQKNADDLDGEEETVGGKILVFFVTIIIILIWLAIFAMLIKLDVGGFGSGVLAPVIKDVPYLNKILPDSAVEEVSTEDSQYAYTNLDDAINRIKELEIELADAQNSANSDADYIAELEEKAKELDTYKQNEAVFEQEKEKWYEDVVFSDDAPDISNYKEYYESIDAANAEVLYKQVVEQTLTDEQMDDYVKTYSNMKPKEAAAIFDTMTDNLQLVADILSNLDTQSRADILGKMNSDTAAKVTEIMEPSE